MNSRARIRRSGQYELASSDVLRAAAPQPEWEHPFPSNALPFADSPGVAPDVKLRESILRILEKHVGEIMARSVLIHCIRMCSVVLERMRPGDAEKLLSQLEKALRLYLQSASGRKACTEELAALLGRRKEGVASGSESHRIVPITTELDIVTARNAGRDICRDLGFSVTGQIRVATAISELARNIVLYTPGGTMELTMLTSPRPGIEIQAKDSGSGIANLDQVLAGEYVSSTGMGKGLAGTRQLMDSFTVRSGPGGTEITALKYLSAGETRKR